MRRILASGILLLLLSMIGCQANLRPEDSSAKVRRARAFINAVAIHNERQAFDFLTRDAKAAVLEYCPNGELLGCFDELGWGRWGSLEDIAFDYGVQEISAFTVKMENQTIRIVIVTSLEDGKWLISGWRGVVPVSYGGPGDQDSEGWPMGLIDGTNPINQFPPDE